jgi:hypothetical protein
MDVDVRTRVSGCSVPDAPRIVRVWHRVLLDRARPRTASATTAGAARTAGLSTWTAVAIFYSGRTTGISRQDLADLVRELNVDL